MYLRRLLIVMEPGRDGVLEYVSGQIEHLHRKHPEVEIDLAFSSRRSSEALFKLVERVRAKGGEAIDLEVSNAPQWADFRAVARLIGLVRRRRPQVVDAESSKAGGLCRLLRIFWPGFPPVLYTPHAFYGLGGDRSLKTFLYNLIEAFLGRTGLTLAISSDERRFGMKTLALPAKKILLIHMCLDVRRFQPAPPGAKEAMRAKFGLPPEARVLVSVGRASHQKNYPPLYQALGSLLADPALNLFFVHAGAGGEELGRVLPPAARERFLPLAYVNPIEELYWAADAFILASRYEGLSLSALGALSCGLKMFLTRVPGNRCFAPLGFSGIGWIKPSEDPAILAEHIETTIRSWVAHPDIAKHEHDHVAQARYWFDSEVQYEKTFRLLNRIAYTSSVK